MHAQDRPARMLTGRKLLQQQRLKSAKPPLIFNILTIICLPWGFREGSGGSYLRENGLSSTQEYRIVRKKRCEEFIQLADLTEDLE